MQCGIAAPSRGRDSFRSTLLRLLRCWQQSFSMIIRYLLPSLRYCATLHCEVSASIDMRVGLLQRGCAVEEYVATHMSCPPRLGAAMPHCTTHGWSAVVFLCARPWYAVCPFFTRLYGGYSHDHGKLFPRWHRQICESEYNSKTSKSTAGVRAREP